MASEIAAPKPDLDAKATKRRFWCIIFQSNFKRKITSAKIATIFWQITVAAWMQPLQYGLQSPAAKTIVLRMQPFHCDPQPEIQETHRTTQTDTTTRCKTHRRNQFAHETTPAAPAAHVRYLSSSAAATLHGKTQGFVLRLPPHKIAHATLTQPFQCNLQPKIQEPHRTTRTDTTTRCKTHRRNMEEPIREWNDPSRTRRTCEVPFIVGCSHFTRQNTRFRAPAPSPQDSPCNLDAAIPMQSATKDSRTA